MQERFSIGGFVSQLIHIAIIFWIFKKYVADMVTKHIEHRKEMMKKLANAQNEYDAIVADGKAQRAALINEGVSRKQEIIDEAKILAGRERDEIIENAQSQADRIRAEAQLQADRYEQQLAAERTHALNETTKTVVKKLMNNKEIKQQYVDGLVQEFTQQHKK